MRKFFLILLSALLMCGCEADFDGSGSGGGSGTVDDGLLNNLLERVQRLENLCSQANTNIASMQTILMALQSNDCVTGVAPVVQNGETIGYTISFVKSAPITIYHGQNGKDGVDGADGKDGRAPVIGVRQDADGLYYWTLDGEWLLDASGNKMKTAGSDGQKGDKGNDGADGKDGITPQLKIENGYWYVSTDGGRTWTNLGKATGENGKDGGDSMFSSVEITESSVKFTLTDGTSFSIPKDAPFNITFANTDTISCAPGSTYRIAYTIEGASSSTSVEALAQDGLKASVERTDESSGFVVVTLPLSIVERSTVIVFASNGSGKILMKSLNFVYDGSGVLIITATEPLSVGAEGGTVSVSLHTNLNYRVEIAEDAALWLHAVPATRAAMREETLTFSIDKNTEAERRGLVYLIDLSDDSIAQTLCITQSGDEAALSEIVNFNDQNFENYVVANYDLDGDGKISRSEALKVVSLNVSRLSITDLTGLEWFKNLTELYCNYTNLTSLDLSENRALVSLNCSSTKITELDLSNNTALEELSCSSGNNYWISLQSLNVRNCAKLRTLKCSTQNLSTIDLSGCPELTVLDVSSNKLQTLDISKNKQLTDLNCYSNNLKSLDLSANPLLKTVKIPCTSIELGSSFETFRVNVSGYTEASSLSVSALGLKKLTIFSSGLQSLNLVGCPDIEDLSVAQMNIEKLDVSMLSKLKTLCVDWCPNLSALDLRGNPELEKFSGSSCSSLKDLDISVNPKLKSLFCPGTKITSLDLSANPMLESVECNGCKIQSLDVTRCPELKTLRCQNNVLETLDVSCNPKLTELNCSNMATLTTLFMDSSQRIRYITYDRSTTYIPEQTEIVYR